MSSWTPKTNDVTPNGDNVFVGNNTFNGSTVVNGSAAFTSSLSIMGPLTVAIIKYPLRTFSVSGDAAVTANDCYIIINKSFVEATKVNMPTTAQTGQAFFIKDGGGNAATSNITVSAAAGIDGSANYVINANFNTVALVWNGTKFNVV